MAAIGLARKSPLFIKSAMNVLMTSLSCGSPLQSTTETFSREPEHSPAIHEVGLVHSTETNHTEIGDITPLNLPRAHAEIQPPLETDDATVIISPHLPPQAHSEPLSPVSPTGSVTDQDPNDPRVRNTSREDFIEMEVPLPSRASPSSTGAPRSSPSAHGPEGAAPSTSPPKLGKARAPHRVTKLSSEPANMLGEALAEQIVSWATLPLKLIALRLVASHFYANHPYEVKVFEMKPVRTGMLGPRGDLDGLSWRSIGVCLSRLALCGAMQLAIDLAIWGCQWTVITWTGKRFYSWGSL
jgi:hypothetical protein